MSTINDGGPAFPVAQWNNDSSEYTVGGGMTLRDYFAAKAMQAHITNVGSDDINEFGVALWSYDMADAMLKALEEQK